MTILHVLNMGGYSGAENVVINIIRAFRERNPEVRFVYVSPDGIIREILEENGIEFVPIRRMSVGKLRRIFRRYAPDLIHAHDFTAGVTCALAAGNTPVISHIHNNSPWIGTFCLRTLLYALCCPRFIKILSVSEAFFSEFRFGGKFKEKETVLPNPFDPSRTVRLAREASDRRAFDVVFLGRLEPPKDPLRFVQLIASLNRIHPVSAVMIGEGSLRTKVEKMISDEGLGRVITLTGFMKNPYGILDHSRVLCMPSAWEGFGLAAAEALSLGTPVAASRVGGLTGVIGEAGAGKLCSTDDEFVEYLSTMLDGGEPYRTACAAASRRADELDNTHEYIEKLAGIYGI